jgi:hypothetical protein
MNNCSHVPILTLPIRYPFGDTERGQYDDDEC